MIHISACCLISTGITNSYTGGSGDFPGGWVFVVPGYACNLLST